jgi:hypothetical protein
MYNLPPSYSTVATYVDAVECPGFLCISTDKFPDACPSAAGFNITEQVLTVKRFEIAERVYNYVVGLVGGGASTNLITDNNLIKSFNQTFYVVKTTHEMPSNSTLFAVMVLGPVILGLLTYATCYATCYAVESAARYLASARAEKTEPKDHQYIKC